MELQLNNIQDGFAELQRKIEEKKQDIIAEFERKYKREEQRLMNKEKIVNANQEEIANIEQIYEELDLGEGIANLSKEQSFLPNEDDPEQRRIQAQLEGDDDGYYEEGK